MFTKRQPSGEPASSSWVSGWGGAQLLLAGPVQKVPPAVADLCCYQLQATFGTPGARCQWSLSMRWWPAWPAGGSPPSCFQETTTRCGGWGMQGRPHLSQQLMFQLPAAPIPPFCIAVHPCVRRVQVSLGSHVHALTPLAAANPAIHAFDGVLRRGLRSLSRHAVSAFRA